MGTSVSIDIGRSGRPGFRKGLVIQAGNVGVHSLKGLRRLGDTRLPIPSGPITPKPPKVAEEGQCLRSSVLLRCFVGNSGNRCLKT